MVGGRLHLGLAYSLPRQRVEGEVMRRIINATDPFWPDMLRCRLAHRVLGRVIGTGPCNSGPS
jgi:hypothetical protein